MAKLDLRGKGVAIQWHGESPSLLRETLERGGAHVFEAMAYTYSLELEPRGMEVLAAVGFTSMPPDESRVLQLTDDLVGRTIQVITFTSPPSVRNLFRVAARHGRDHDLGRSLNEQVLVVAVGPPTGRAIEEHGVHVDVMPAVYKLGPMVRALVDHLADRRPNGRKKVLGGGLPQNQDEDR